MIRQLTLAATVALGLGSGAALAAGKTGEVTDYSFSFEGPFGSYDQMQLQRGLQVYTEICSACHGLQYVPLRTLGDPGGPGLPEDQVRAYAEFYEVFDPTLFDGEGDFRAATPNDNFPGSMVSNAPDLSLMAKGRAGFSGPYGLGINQFFRGMGGAEYIASLLAGYTGEEKEEAGAILYENTAFPGGWISMAPPLWGDDVEFADGSPTDIESLSKDVSAFLMWTAEPKMMARLTGAQIRLFVR
ncbi:MAG: cytochrome c1 [Pseudomonadota bacterium]